MRSIHADSAVQERGGFPLGCVFRCPLGSRATSATPIWSVSRPSHVGSHCIVRIVSSSRCPVSCRAGAEDLRLYLLPHGLNPGRSPMDGGYGALVVADWRSPPAVVLTAGPTNFVSNFPAQSTPSSTGGTIDAGSLTSPGPKPRSRPACSTPANAAHGGKR